MGQVVKSFMGIFFLVALVLLGCGILGAQMSSVQARDYKAAVITEISDSGCNQTVIDSCISQAVSDGYGLKVILYEYDGRKMAEVTLEYDYCIPFLNYKTKHQLRGYAV